ncbi:hypothetical protein EVAR_17454_1 [Eumeta japonica]|uniref:Uncharacterized protein n=1 Tax=Eumeta variegata TaxID=151549 RepID=A0A4C1VB89_EUMVA|nr:hypothetical protein EVAR_17454_1 [Eumeta japonica]
MRPLLRRYLLGCCVTLPEGYSRRSSQANNLVTSHEESGDVRHGRAARAGRRPLAVRVPDNLCGGSFPRHAHRQ